MISLLIPIFPYYKANAASSKSAPLSTIEEIYTAFPESYWEQLETLKEKYPKWKFVAFNTGLTWEQLFTESAEAYPSRNLAHGYIGGELYFPTSWYSTDISGAYNWAGNDWTRYDNGSWLQASKEAIAYCMDPRNFLDEIQIFQFMDTASALEEEDSIKAVSTILQSSYYKQSGESADLYDYIAEDGLKHYIDFPTALTQIGMELGLNQVTLASRLYQENSNGNSPLISGDRAFTTKDGKYIEGGYYNYFNVGASGNSNSTIILNGLLKAYENGWDTKYKSLLGGAEEIMKSFVKRGQTTIYFQKFAVDSSSSRLFWGQYMQNITAPQSESKNVQKAIEAAGALQSDLTFIIPIFENMPEENPYPEKDGNPNYKLGSIYVDSNSLSGFNSDIEKYTYSTSKDNIKVNILAYAPTTTISYIDPINKETVSSDGKLKSSIGLVYGDNIIEFVCTAQNGDIKTYTITVTSTYKQQEDEALPIEPPTISPTNPETPPIEEDTQPPDDSTTSPPSTDETNPDNSESDNNSNNTTPTYPTFNPWFPNKDNEDNQENESNQEDSDDYETNVQPYKYIDPTQDGEWDIFDVAVIYGHILGTSEIEEWRLELCDVNHDKVVDIFDASVIYQHILEYIDLNIDT